LNKPGKLTQREFKIMQGHALEGYKVLQDNKGIHPEVLRGVAEHHERLDGRGYPKNISGENIGFASRILAVVDVYDALTSKRVYKPAIAPSKALGMLYRSRGEKFCPAYVEVFIKSLGVYPMGSFVRLTNGEYGVVVNVDAMEPLKPKVKIVFDAKMRSCPSRIVDLASRGMGGEPALEITDCLNPADYKIDVSKIFF
jgi:HD-GYP domain-containing protein (c-di-GMP phosphodiesterase class II)